MDRQTWHHLLESQFLGNAVRNYFHGLLTILAGLIAVWVVEKLILRWLERLTRYTETTFDDFLIQTGKRLVLPALYAVVIFLGTKRLALNPVAVKVLSGIVIVIVAMQGVRFVVSVIRELLERQMAQRSGAEAPGDQEKGSVRGVMVVVQLIIWTLALVLVLDNLGIRVSTFVAGLGISGIAVALAAQAILGDLFSHFVIFFDRPFQIGHSIKVGNFQGEVESIGIKTTRLRSLSGEQVVISNKFLTDNQVQNFKVMSRRRALMLFELDYKTTEARLREIPGLIQTIVSGFEDATFERAHFKEFGESGLRFEAVYFVETAEYKRYMDVVQDVNLQLKSRLEGMGVSFAHPTRTVHMISE